MTVALLASAPGSISADTKVYLYLDPGRLLGRATSMWDPHVGLGTVTHQTIGYLWPMGPWFWVFERLGAPDWVAQRLWWATLITAAVAGTAFLLRRFAWPGVAVWPAALVYGLSPFFLTLFERLSALLLPWAGLPWLVGLTVCASRAPRSWRYPALFALVTATVGSVNLTALVLAGIGPVLWLAYALVVARDIPPADAARLVGRIAVLTTATCAWWIAGLAVQAANGIDIVRYTETARIVSVASTANEVLRGLGYWFFYGGDKLELWNEASFDYTQRPWLLAVTYLVPVLGLLGLGVARWRGRAFAAAAVAVGAVVATGAHPWGQGPPVARLIEAFLGTERGLAMRSLPRAVPLLTLGLAMGVGAGIAALAARPSGGRRLATAAGALVACAAAAGLAPLWGGQLVHDNLTFDEVPGYRRQATAAVDAGGDATRVLELPGADFAAYRWGMTIDPVTPGLTDRPTVARELVPFGSAPSADLLAAFDLALQERTLDPRAVAPVARLLRAGDLLVRNDVENERFDTARPRIVDRLLGAAPGLGAPRPFGPPAAADPSLPAQLRDERWFLSEQSRPDPASVVLVPVQDPVPIVATVPAGQDVVLAGDGAGIVDAAGAGLLRGDELIRYSASLDADALARATGSGAARLVLTDSNRKRGQRWTSLRATQGHTERADESPLRADDTDNRLPVFGPDGPVAGTDAMTVAEQRGPVVVDATSYGPANQYAPEDRAVRAVDGDPATAWRTGTYRDARGERLEVRLDTPRRLDRVRLLQAPSTWGERWITEVGIRLDGGPQRRVALTDESRAGAGQLVAFDARRVGRVDIEILADTLGGRTRYGDAGPVGLAEVDLGDRGDLRADEVVRLPVDLLAGAGRAAATHPLDVVLTRLRQDPADERRDDPEPSLRRTWELPARRRFTLSGTARLSGRAGDGALDALTGRVAPGLRAESLGHLSGALDRASATLDGDPATVWTSRRGTPVGQGVAVEADAPVTVDGIDVGVVADGDHSVPTGLDVVVDGVVVARPELEPVLDGPLGTIATRHLAVPATTGRRVEVRVRAVRAVTTQEWNTAAPIDQPVALAEVAVAGLRLPAARSELDTGCRPDLVRLDGEPVPVRVRGPMAAALAGDTLEVTGCGPVDLGAGAHLLATEAGRASGLDLDQLVLRSPAPRPLGPPSEPAGPPRVQVLHDGDDHVRARIDGLTPGRAVWFVLGQSVNDGWRAVLHESGLHESGLPASGSAASGNAKSDLGAPELVDGFANGWLVRPQGTSAVIDVRFGPQRAVAAASWLSLASALGCAVVALRPRRRTAATAVATVAAPVTPAPSWRWGSAGRGPRCSPARAAATGAAVALGAALVLPVPAALGLALAGAAAARRRAWQRLLQLLPAGCLGLAGAYVVGRQARDHLGVGLEWTTDMDRAHLWGVAAVVALATLVVVDGDGGAHGDGGADGDGAAPGAEGIRRRRGADRYHRPVPEEGSTPP